MPLYEQRGDTKDRNKHAGVPALIHFGIAPYLNWTMVRAGSLAYILKDDAGQALLKHRPAAFPMFTLSARRYTA